jgi:hypothetical protein
MGSSICNEFWTKQMIKKSCLFKEIKPEVYLFFRCHRWNQSAISIIASNFHDLHELAIVLLDNDNAILFNIFLLLHVYLFEIK